MISEDDEMNYAFWDYLNRGIEGHLPRETLEHQWHKEKQTPDKTKYNPDPDQIPVQHPTYDEFQDSKR